MKAANSGIYVACFEATAALLTLTCVIAVN